MTSPLQLARRSGARSRVTLAAQWLADRNSSGIADIFAPILPALKARFGLTDADAAEAILLAGNYSICRKAFGRSFLLLSNENKRTLREHFFVSSNRHGSHSSAEVQ